MRIWISEIAHHWMRVEVKGLTDARKAAKAADDYVQDSRWNLDTSRMNGRKSCVVTFEYKEKSS